MRPPGRRTRAASAREAAEVGEVAQRVAADHPVHRAVGEGEGRRLGLRQRAARRGWRPASPRSGRRRWCGSRRGRPARSGRRSHRPGRPESSRGAGPGRPPWSFATPGRGRGSSPGSPGRSGGRSCRTSGGPAPSSPHPWEGRTARSRARHVSPARGHSGVVAVDDLGHTRRLVGVRRTSKVRSRSDLHAAPHVFHRGDGRPQPQFGAHRTGEGKRTLLPP